MNQRLHEFAERHHVQGLTEMTLQALQDHVEGYEVSKAQRFLRFQERINSELLTHEIIQNNAFCNWFEKGELDTGQVRAFVIQFSVFSNLFLIAQLKKMINADTLDGMHASKEILANEIGVIFNSGRPSQTTEPENEIVSEEGTIEGGRFRFSAAHFEWLVKMGEALNMSFNDMGKRHHGTQSTLFFCDELSRLYGSEDYMISQAASYAVENWAAAGFWDQLVTGFKKFNQKSDLKLPLGFFVWHARIEAQHAAHTQEELEELYFSRNINEDDFIRQGNKMLDSVAVFWDGLDDLRKQFH
ncbi:hypothetical protein ACFL2V_00795 [Pseudomonadota bacterium]